MRRRRAFFIGMQDRGHFDIRGKVFQRIMEDERDIVLTATEKGISFVQYICDIYEAFYKIE